MAQQRLSVRKIAEILRLRFEQRLTPRAIAGAANCALSTVQECLRRAETAGVGWPLPPEWDEAALRTRLYPKPVATGDYRLPDFGTVHTELARKGVTRWLLWQEYKSRYPEGLQYTVFCNHYRRGLATQDAVLRPVHAPGEKRFVDYAGQTVGESRVRHHFLSPTMEPIPRPPILAACSRWWRRRPPWTTGTTSSRTGRSSRCTMYKEVRVSREAGCRERPPLTRAAAPTRITCTRIISEAWMSSLMTAGM